MDRNQKINDPTQALLLAMEGNKSSIWTAMPGIVQSFDPTQRTAVVQPSIQAAVWDANEVQSWQNMPLLPDCPVIFPGGGGVLLTFPLQPGDEVLVLIANRCIDYWWQRGGIQQQAELRMMDLSDGFCLAGIQSLPNVAPAISTTETQLRSQNGAVRIGLNPTTQAISVVTPGAATVQSGSLAATVAGAASVAAGGALSLSGATVSITGVLTINGEAYTAHRHTGVTPGASNTGGKTP